MPTIATAAGWNNKPLPARHIALKLDFHRDAAGPACDRHGLLPFEMEDTWFPCFEGNTLCMHRFWTGVCIVRVRFDGRITKFSDAVDEGYMPELRS